MSQSRTCPCRRLREPAAYRFGGPIAHAGTLEASSSAEAVYMELLARLNATMAVALLIFAVSASCAIFLILELSQPFTGLMQISDEPLRHALAPL